jgi:hypothetical protein
MRTSSSGVVSGPATSASRRAAWLQVTGFQRAITAVFTQRGRRRDQDPSREDTMSRWFDLRIERTRCAPIAGRGSTPARALDPRKSMPAGLIPQRSLGVLAARGAVWVVWSG